MKKKFFLITTIPNSLFFFKNQICKLNHNFDITLISSPGEKLELIARNENVKYKAIPMKRNISIKKDIISFIKFFWLFLTQRPAVIHCNTPKAALLGLFSGFITRIPTRIYYIHGLRYEGETGRKQKILIAIEKLCCFCATDIIAVSKGIKQKVEKKLTNKKISLIHNGSPNGLSVQDFIGENYNKTKIRQELDISEEDFVFGFVGRLVGDKGINELVYAFNQLEQKNIKLILIGPYEKELDPLKEETMEIIKNNKNIIELGFQANVKKYLIIMDLFVSPSYREGFGLSVLEANLMGIPVLVTKITGYSDIVTEGKNGFFITKKDTVDLKNKMQTLLKSKEYLTSMKTDCQVEVINNYDHKDVLKHALSYYAQFK